MPKADFNLQEYMDSRIEFEYPDDEELLDLITISQYIA